MVYRHEKNIKIQSFLIITMLSHLLFCILNVDTWILYRGGRKEVSRVVRNAYVGAIRKSGLSVKLISVGGALVSSE